MIRALMSLILIGTLQVTAVADVSVGVYRADEQTPLAPADPNTPGLYEDIMVGTRLSLFISSDIEGIWNGDLWLSPEAASVGTISGRGYNPEGKFRSHEGSCLKAAGRNPLVYVSTGSDGVKVSFLSARDATAGEWFVLDYEAKAVGRCDIELHSISMSSDVVSGPDPYTEGPPPFERHLIQTLTFHHVPTRDFDASKVVDFTDFAILASGFAGTCVADPNQGHSLDLNEDCQVDIFDVAAFSEYWLERTDVDEPVDTGIE